MTNLELATELMINYLESENITADPAVAAKWEARFPSLDFISLAALAIADPTESALTISEIRYIRDFFFPSKI